MGRGKVVDLFQFYDYEKNGGLFAVINIAMAWFGNFQSFSLEAKMVASKKKCGIAATW